MDNENTTYTQETEVHETASTDAGMNNDMNAPEERNGRSFGALVGLILLAVLLALAALFFYNQDGEEAPAGDTEGDEVVEDLENTNDSDSLDAIGEDLENTNLEEVGGELDAEVDAETSAE